MPVTLSGQSVFPRRVELPRGMERGIAGIPALVGAGDRGARPFAGRSRFAISPLLLSLDQLLFLITAALLCFGLVMVQSAESRIRGVHDNWLGQAFHNKNTLHAVIALAVMTLMWRIDYRIFLGNPRGKLAILRSPAAWLVVLTVGFLAAVLVTPFGKEINGARRWFGVGALSFQPSELAKLSLVMFVAAYATIRASQMRDFFLGFLPLVGVFGICAALVIKEDFGTTVLIAAVVMTMLLMAGCRWWHVGMLIPPAGLVVWAAIFRDHNSFRYKRFMAFKDPFSDPSGAGYHLIQSLLTIASGGMRGLGLGNGIQKMGYLPEDNTDFIFAVICEELGIVGALMVIGLFAAFVIVGWRVMSRCENLFGKMVAFGITAIIGLQAAINIAVVTASMPTKGIALPLISSGGTGWIMNAAAIGVLMSIERINRQEAAAARHLSRVGAGQGFPVEVQAVPVVEAMPVVSATPVVIATPVESAA